MVWDDSLAKEKAATLTAAGVLIALGVDSIHPVLDSLTPQQRGIIGVLCLAIGGSLYWVREVRKKSVAKTPKKGKK